MTASDSGKTPRNTSVFICYSRANIDVRNQLQQQLEDKAIVVAGDWRLEPGPEYPDQLKRLIRQSDVFVFALTTESLASPNCRWEVAMAVLQNKRIQTFGVGARGADRFTTSEWPEWCGPSDINALPTDNQLRHVIALPQWVSAQETNAYDKLADSVRSDLELTAEHTDLLVALDRWNRHGRGAALTLRGRDLRRAKRWLALVDARNPELLPKATAEQRMYVAASTRNSRIRIAGFVVVAIAIAGLAAAVYQTRRRSADNAARQQLSALQLPSGLASAPALESLTIETPLAQLDWVPRQVRRLNVPVNEDGTPKDFPDFVTDLTLSGHGDTRTQRYYVDIARLPRGLTSLRLKNVNVQHAAQLSALRSLKTLSLHDAYVAPREVFELSAGVESLEGDWYTFNSVPPAALGSLKALAIIGGGYDKVDAQLLPRSLLSLSIAKAQLVHAEALKDSHLTELRADDMALLDYLPPSLSKLSLTLATVDDKKMRRLRYTTLKELEINQTPRARPPLPEPPEPPLQLDANWLPDTLTVLLMPGLGLAHDERLATLPLTRVSIGSGDDLPGTVKSMTISGCSEADELKPLPKNIERLEVPCLSGYSKAARILQQYKALTSFTALELSNDIDFKKLPDTLTELAIGATSSTNAQTIAHLQKLTDLTLDFMPGTGGSDVPGSVEENLTILDVNNLPRGLNTLQVFNLRLHSAADLARLGNLRELTVDGYNRSNIGIPPGLRSLTIKAEVSTAELKKMLHLPE